MAGKAGKKKEKKLRQKYLPRMKPRSNPRIDRAAELYEDAKIELAAAGQSMKDGEANLRALMKEAKLEYYKTPSGINVMHSLTDRVTTKRDKEGKAQTS